jgi:hypothetical protein
MGTALRKAGLVNMQGRYLWQLVTWIFSAIQFKKHNKSAQHVMATLFAEKL